MARLVCQCMLIVIYDRTGRSVYAGSTVIYDRAGLTLYAGSTVLVIFVRTGLSVYADSTVTGGLCHDWSVSVVVVQ